MGEIVDLDNFRKQREEEEKAKAEEEARRAEEEERQPHREHFLRSQALGRCPTGSPSPPALHPGLHRIHV